MKSRESVLRLMAPGLIKLLVSMKQQVLDNSTSSCIGCGICVTVCPMDVLSFGETNGHKPVKLMNLEGQPVA
ncbi:MAG: 4Fe-4S binding protein [candidate division KSB1 bacterium]|nr:4Fe-4S binding protein [candidate division KSB1 bacterium]